MIQAFERAKTHLRTLSVRLRLPDGLPSGQNTQAREVLSRYLSKPEDFWRGPGLRHAVKVKNASRAFMELGIQDPLVLTELLLQKVAEIQYTRNRPFFVMGAGGSGTTWLGAIIGDLPEFCYGREIYLPPAISYLYRQLKTQEMIQLVWAISILPSWGFNLSGGQFDHDFVNSGRSIFNYDIYREIWPTGRFIFLARDPRDQLLSVTYRKPSYREAVAPGKGDLEYLKYNARKFMKIYKAYKSIDPKDLLLVRYETLKQDTVGELRKILHWGKVTVAEEMITKAVTDNDSQNMRIGRVPFRGNLDEGGIAKSWQELMTRKEKLLIKPILQEALETFGYEKNTAW